MSSSVVDKLKALRTHLDEIIIDLEKQPPETGQISIPQEFKDVVTLTEEGGYVVIRPKRFLGTDLFAKVSRWVRDLGGEYVSAVRESHWRIRKT